MSTRDDGLEGRTAIISGGASGIGQALAAAYARCGVNSVIGYFPGDDHDPNLTVEAVERAGAECEAVELDVGSIDQTERFAQVALDRWQRLDICVAAAGILCRQALSEMTDQAWDAMMTADLTGMVRVFRSGAARMHNGGAMVGVSSIAGGVYGWQDHSHYAAAKAGALGLCRSLAVELAPRDIRVNAVIPGLIESPQSLDADNSLGPEGLQAAGEIIPMGRVGQVDEAARVIRFLTSDDSAYVTGQSLIVDGGLTVRWPSA